MTQTTNGTRTLVRRAAALVAAGTLGATAVRAQDGQTPACGPSPRRGPAMAVQVDSLVTTRSVFEIDRVSRELRAQGVVGGGRVQLGPGRGWLGLRTSEVSELRLTTDGRMVRYCDYPVVVSVEPASPASKAGVEAGDTIVSYNGADLRAAGEVALDRLLVPGDTLRVGLRRDGRTLSLPLVVGRAPNAGALAGGVPGFTYVIVSGNDGAAVPPVAPTPPAVPGVVSLDGAVRVATARARAARDREIVSAAAAAAPRASLPRLSPTLLAFGWGGPSAFAGAQVVAMDDDLRAVLGARGGVLVLKVGEGTPASESGLRSGDVILSADGFAVTTPAGIQQALLRNRGDRAVPLKVERKGKTRDVVLRW